MAPSRSNDPQPLDPEIAAILAKAEAAVAAGREREREANRSPEELAAAEAVAAERRAKSQADTERETRERRLANLRAFDVPELIVRKLCEGKLDPEKKAARLLMEAWGDDMDLIVLSGAPGCGKTAAACLLLDREAATSSGLFLSAWTRSRTPVWSDDAGVWGTVPLLVVDDLGQEYMDEKGWGTSVLDLLLTQRYHAALRTVITTNLPATRFAERFGERVLDRIRGVGVFIELREPSLRGRQSAP